MKVTSCYCTGLSSPWTTEFIVMITQPKHYCCENMDNVLCLLSLSTYIQLPPPSPPYTRAMHLQLQKDLLRRFFSLFYFSINAGSVISTLLTPVLRSEQRVYVFALNEQ